MKKTVIKTLISLSLLTFLFTKVVSIDEVIRITSGANFVLLSLAFLFILLNNLTSSLRWKYLIDVAKVKYWFLFRLYFVGNFFNNFMPSSIGGDVYKIVKLRKVIDDNGPHATAATFMERFTGLVALAILASIALMFSGIYPFYYGLLLLVLFLSGLVFGIFVLYKFHHLHSALEKFYLSFASFKDKREVVTKAFLLSFLVQLFAIITQYLVVRSIGIDIPFMFAMFVFPVAGFISFFPISFNGVGIQEFMYINLLALIGVSANLAISASILYFIVRMLSSLLGAVFYYFYND